MTWLTSGLMSDWIGLFVVTGLWITATLAGLSVLKRTLGREGARAVAGASRKGVRRV